MKELIKRSILLGLGAASLTKEKVDKLVKEFVKKKSITKNDARWVAKQVLSELKKSRKRIKDIGMMKGKALRKKARYLESRLVKRGSKTAKNIIRKVGKGLA